MTMKEEDLSLIKRYPIVEYLERKGIKPVRRTPTYVMYRSPLREETHPSFKVDTEKNLWIDYAEGRGGRIIDLSVCDWRTARCRKPSAVWGRPLPLIQRATMPNLQRRRHTAAMAVSDYQKRKWQTGQGD